MKKLAEKDPAYFTEQAEASMARTSPPWSVSWTTVPRCSTTATRSATKPSKARLRPGLRLPRIRSRLHPPAVRGRAWGRSAGPRCPATPGHRSHRPRRARTVPRQPSPAPVDHHGTGEGDLSGSAARICWLGYGERHLAGLRFNEMVANGEVSAPIVIGRDHLDSGSVASPIARPRRWPTAPMPLPTGRCSMRW